VGERRTKTDVVLLTEGKVADGWRRKAASFRSPTNGGERAHILEEMQPDEDQTKRDDAEVEAFEA
jgi:hypothetical protein